MDTNVTLSINDTQHNVVLSVANFIAMLGVTFFIVMLDFIILNVRILNVVMLNFAKLTDTMLTATILSATMLSAI
jgi:hypothetical protein